MALAMCECAVRRGQVGRLEGRGILMAEETTRMSSFRSILLKGGVWLGIWFNRYSLNRESECSGVLALSQLKLPLAVTAETPKGEIVFLLGPFHSERREGGVFLHPTVFFLHRQILLNSKIDF